jgi:hypothetical protein
MTFVLAESMEDVLAAALVHAEQGVGESCTNGAAAPPTAKS